MTRKKPAQPPPTSTLSAGTKTAARLHPTPEQLASVISSAANFLTQIRDAALVEGIDVPLLPESIQVRQAMAQWAWAEWEARMNPLQKQEINPGIVVQEWAAKEQLLLALRDLYAVRGHIIRHWGLEPCLGAKSLGVSIEPPGEKDGPVSKSGSGSSHAWPPKIPSAWWNVATYCIQRIQEVLILGGACSDGHSDERPVRRDASMEARDKWIYNRSSKKGWREILAELKKVGPKKGWTADITDARVRQAAIAYAKRHNLTPPPKKQGL
jgi:hypothetical protein